MPPGVGATSAILSGMSLPAARRDADGRCDEGWGVVDGVADHGNVLVALHHAGGESRVATGLRFR